MTTVIVMVPASIYNYGKGYLKWISTLVLMQAPAVGLAWGACSELGFVPMGMVRSSTIQRHTNPKGPRTQIIGLLGPNTIILMIVGLSNPII